MAGRETLVNAFLGAGPADAPFTPGDGKTRRALTSARVVVFLLTCVIAYLLATR